MQSRPLALALAVGLAAALAAVACSGSGSGSGRAANPGSALRRTATTTAPPSTTTPETTIPLPPRPYPVATTTLAYVDPNRATVSRGHQVAATRSLTTVVWYPTVGTTWPLVVFAPGYVSGPDTYAHMLATWAAAGYVVAAPEFPLGDAAVAGPALDEGDLQSEPQDLRFVMGSLIAPGSPMLSRIDPMRMAVAGHSDGAEAALSVAQQGDITIHAVIAMAAQPVVPHVAPNPPLLVAQGDADSTNPPARGRAVFDQAAAPRYLLVLEGAGHLPPFAGATPWQPVVDQVTVDFLDRYVAGTTDSDAAITADGNRPGLTQLLSGP